MKKQKSIFKRDEYILIRKVFCITTRNVNIIKELLLYYVIFESVSISNYQLTHILSIHWILCRQEMFRIQIFFFLSFFCIDKEVVLTSKSMCFNENSHSYNYLYREMLDIFFQLWRVVAQHVHYYHTLYLIYWSVYLDLMSGKASLCLPQIVNRRNYLNWDHR